MTLTERPLLAVESRTDTPLFDAIAAAHDKLTHQMRTRPPLETPILTATTDASFFRRKGMVVYGFEPIPRDLDAERTQAKEDSIALSSLKFAIDVTETYLQDFLSRTALRPSAALK
jgi:acetylornithine deacetylase/succinyl-diaminopimelate desuccinylase-like protein